MFKIPSKLSVMISVVMAVVLFAAMIVSAVFLPDVVTILIDKEDTVGPRGDITEAGRAVVLALSYAALALAMVAVVLLFILLMRVRRGLIFSCISVSIIRYVSWCCFGFGAVFVPIGYYFQLAFVVAFAAVFLGFCLRVVKNVLEEATEIKSENDFTV